MAYPFLPVNPCCTDVVLNTPCGCSSTITNSGCNNNNPCSTHLTASSTIVYDGPVLPCIVAEPCDTLNVILQKIDEIICNLLTQINYLTNQVSNITNQIITINGDIINIYNTLGECCSATTTTTSTTTAAPCESFSLDNTGDAPVAIIITDCITGDQEAIVLLPGETNICVETDSPLTVPGTVIVTPNGPCGPTTTTTTSSSSTTTTTTTISPCECLTFYNDSINSQEITYIDCNGVNQYDIILPYATNSYCGCCGEAPGSLDVSITIGGNCIDGLCPAEPTTTTTTTEALCDCYDTEITITSEILAITDDGQVTVLYNDCFTNPYIDTYSRPGVYPLGCVNYLVGIVALGQVDGVESSIYVPITVGNPCCEGTTTTTTTIAPTTTTTTTLPCNCVDVIISQDDLDDATGNTLPFFDGKVNLWPEKELTCQNENLDSYYSVAGTYTYCLKGDLIPTIILQYVKNDAVITSVQSQIVNLGTPCLVNGECLPTTTTTTTTVEPTTTTTTTCNPLTNHGFGMQMIYGTSTFPNFLTSLPDACGSVVCLNPEFSTCTVSSSVLVYWDSEFPIVGDSAYGAPSGCELASMTDGYYLFGFGTGNYVVVEIINSTIVSFPICPTTTTTTTVEPTTTTTSTSSTTTTTTTAFLGACTCFHVAINQADITDATGNTDPGRNGKVYLQTAKGSGCDGAPDISGEYSTFTSDGFCITTSLVNTIQLFYYKNDVPIYYPATASSYNVLYTACSVNGECLPV